MSDGKTSSPNETGPDVTGTIENFSPLKSPETASLPEDLMRAVRGAQDKKAEEMRIFDLRGVTSLTEYFLICSGTNQRQNQAIADEILKTLKEKSDRLALGIEGYDKADWILMDYGDFIVHILSAQARKYYDLERLWRQAKECEVPPDAPPSASITPTSA